MDGEKLLPFSCTRYAQQCCNSVEHTIEFWCIPSEQRSTNIVQNIGIKIIFAHDSEQLNNERAGDLYQETE